ncbi:MAG: hypothetical protein ABJK37_10380 [Paraglaciecola sp.]|uniref:NACHT domain-containing protein n=1 Tax=Paraglaciecola sp. TaxID=1920173 RepID=UPI003299B4BB
MATRDNFDYIADINFLNVSLLSFTEEQLIKFIFGWCESQEDAKQLEKSIEKRNLYSVLGNPLLATIACTLISQGIKVPNCESRLYEERIRLLTGEYDSAREINRQSVRPEILSEVAKFVAFKMHSLECRSIGKDILQNYLIEKFSRNYSVNIIINALNELITPCNVLILDRETDLISFDHFRYQESLTAQYIETIQFFEIVSYLKSEFWTGAFILFAEKKSIVPIIEELVRGDYLYDSYFETLKAMILNSSDPKHVRQGQLEIINMHSSESSYKL